MAEKKTNERVKAANPAKWNDGQFVPVDPNKIVFAKKAKAPTKRK